MRNLKFRLLDDNRTIKTLSVIGLSLVLSSGVWAQNSEEKKWWFDVELIVFKRTLLPTNTENFEQEQFDLDITNSNNLLYMEALKQAFQFAPLTSTLPGCDAKLQGSNDIGVAFDFEYIPDPTQALFNPDPLDERQIPIVNTPSTPDQFNDLGQSGDLQNVNSYKRTALTKSNQSMIESLLIPFDINTTSNNDEIKDLNDSFAYTNNLQDTSETMIQPSNRLDELDVLIKELNELIEKSDDTPSQLTCLYDHEEALALSESALPSIGPTLFSNEDHFRGTDQVISVDDLSMSEYSKQVFRQRDIQPLLYTAWRQNVEFGIENADFYRIRAGNRLKTAKKVNYDTWHNQYQIESVSTDSSADESGFFNELQNALEANNPVDWLTTESTNSDAEKSDFVEQTKYEIEGQLKVYLDYVNQVPYLHIDSEFNHYRLVLDSTGSSSLDTFPLKQRRRIISKQIHYFDHPAFGLIVRLERFTPPAVD